MYGHRGRSSSSDPYWLYAMYVWQAVIWHHLTCKLQLAIVQVGSDSMENGSGRLLSCCWFTPPEVKTLTANGPFLFIDSPRIQWSRRNPYHGELTWSTEAGQGTVPEARIILYSHLMWTSGGAESIIDGKPAQFRHYPLLWKYLPSPKAVGIKTCMLSFMYKPADREPC